MKVGMKNGTSQMGIAAAVGALGLVLALGAPAWAITYSTQYEMSADPSTAGGVLDDNPGDANGPGLLSVGPAGSGSTFAGGIMHYIDNTSSGNLGYYFNQAAAADIAYTIDIRVKANNNVNANTDARSLGFKGGTSKGRGLKLNNPGGGVCTVGSAQLTSGASSEVCVDLSAFRRLRIVVDGAANGGLGLLKVWDFDSATLLFSASTLGDGGVAGEIPNGGFHLGSLSGGITTATDFELDYVRVLLGSAIDDGTTVIDQIAPPSCLVTVTPEGTAVASGYELGATPAPDPVVHTINNLGSSTINYTVSEVDVNGAAFDHPWLSLSGTNGSLLGGNNVGITSTLSTATLAAGTHTAYLKFTDDCPAPAPCTDAFAYTNGDLVGQGGWTGSAVTVTPNLTPDIEVVGGEIKFTADNNESTGDIDAVKNFTCQTDGDGITSVKFKARQGVGADFIYDITARDGSGAVIGWWRGTGTFLRARTPASSSIGDTPLDVGFSEYEMRINTLANTTQYLKNGVPITTLAFPATGGSSVSSIRLVRLPRDDAGGQHAFIDDLSVSVLDQRFRTITLNVTGCEIQVQEPRRRVLGQCNPSSTTTEVFTIKNTGSADWTGFTVIEDGDDDDWATLSFTSSPVARFATAEVTVTIDWSQVPITSVGDDQVSHLQYSASCDGGATFDNDELPGGQNDITIMDSTALPVLSVLYNGDVEPTDNDAGGTNVKFELFDTSSNLGGVVADPGVGQATDGLAYLANDNTSGAQMKWRSVTNSNAAGPNIDSTVGATALARVKTISASSTQGGNLSILEAAISGSYHWGGPNNVAQETLRGNSSTPTGDDDYHIIRITSEDTQGTLGRIVRLYLDENPTPVVNITNASSTNGSSSLDAIGFGVGSNSGLQEIYFDWVSATNVGAFAPGEEVACIGSLIPESNCNVPRVDVDDDNDVDMDDFAVFQTCYTGPLVSPPSLSQLCDCFDVDNDNDIDIADFNAFVNCETGANVPWVTSVNCPS